MQTEKLYSVLYAVTDDNAGDDGKIYQSGPFLSYKDALDFIRRCSNEKSEDETENEDYDEPFNLDERPVYIMTPDHELIHVTSNDIKEKK